MTKYYKQKMVISQHKSIRCKKKKKCTPRRSYLLGSTEATYQEVLRGRVLVYQVRIEYIELVSLHDLGRWIIHIVMRLIVLVPFKPSVNPENILEINMYKVETLDSCSTTEREL